jgi:hypothetical protein
VSCYEIVFIFFKLLYSAPALALLALYRTFSQAFCTSYSSETPRIRPTRRPETSVNFKDLTPPSNPEAPDSNIYHGVSPKSHFICVVTPKDVRHNHKNWDISHFVRAVTQGATRNMLRIRGKFTVSVTLRPTLPDALAQSMFLLNTVRSSPSYFY